jgi:hypothetical protein
MLLEGISRIQEFQAVTGGPQNSYQPRPLVFREPGGAKQGGLARRGLMPPPPLDQI